MKTKTNYDTFSKIKGVYKILLIMKLTMILICVTVFQVTATSIFSQGKKVSLDMQNVTVREVIVEIESQGEINFFYNDDLPELSTQISVSFQDKPIKDVLENTLAQADMTYEVIKDNFVVLIPSPVNATLQPKTITGTVTDEKGDPIPGANVTIKGTTVGTITNLTGRFSIEVADPTNEVLAISFVGYQTQEIAIGDQTEINALLFLDILGLEEVVVVGYGTQMKSELTGSVVSLPKERLDKMQFNNFANAIQGSMPGVTVSPGGGGAEGSDLVILIRGRNSITADIQPLVVLDGIPYSGSYSSINPSDIQSIEVLKDASASAIYGSRGSNGVILITTKKGRAGKILVNAELRYGIRNVANLPEIMNGVQYYDAKMSYDPVNMTPSEEDIHNSSNPNGADWMDLATRQGNKLNAGINIRGGTEKVNYFISYNHLDVEGVSVNDNFRRESFRLNLESKLKSWLTFGTNTQVILSDRSGQEALFGDAFRMNPLTTPYDGDGKLTIYPYPEDNYFENPLGPTLYDDDNRSIELFSNNYLELIIPGVEGLKYRLNTGVDLLTNNHSSYEGRNTTSGFEAGGIARIDGLRKTNIVIENLLTYQKSFGDHNLDVTGLYSFQETVLNRDRLTGRGFDSDILSWYQMDLAELITPEQDYFKTNLLSWMGRINYNYNKKYYATFTIRSDGFSGFGTDTKWGTFPSLALSWNIKNEDFLAASNFVNQLKLRLSYGINGNQAVGPYQTISRMGTSNRDNRGSNRDYTYIDGTTTLPGFIPTVLGTPGLGWEETTSYNIGLDFLFSSFLQGTLDLYNADTDKLLLARTISSTHGIPDIIENIGKVNNKGVELGLTAYIISRGDLQWNVSVIGSYIKNEIVDLYGNGGDDLVNKWFIGQPISSNFDYIFDGIIQTQAEAEAYPVVGFQPGYARVKDLNGDDVIDADDRYLIGKTDPDLNFGISSTLSYKGISLYFLIQGVYGATRRNAALFDDHWDYRRNTTFKEWWTPENGSNTISANSPGTNPFLTGFYQSANFTRLKDLVLSYDLPSTFLDKVGIDGIRIFVQASNLVTWTDWFGMDPEFETINSVGDDAYLDQEEFLPLQKEVAFGASIIF